MDSSLALVGRRTALRAVVAGDVEWLYALATDAHIRGRWRMGAQTPNMDAFRGALFHGSDRQFVVVRRDTSGPVGLVEAYALDHRSGHASIAVLFEPNVWSTGWPLEGALLFVRYMFDVVGSRKLYFDLPEVNRRLVQSSFGRFLTIEATLRNHDFHDGKHLDRTIASISRTDWPSDRIDEIVAPLPAS